MFSASVISLGKGKALSGIKKGDEIEIAFKESGVIHKKVINLITFSVGYAADKLITRGSDCVLFDGFRAVKTGEIEYEDEDDYGV